MVSVEVRQLADTDCEAVADLMLATWPAHYGPNGAGNTANDLAARLAGTVLHCGSVALQGDRVIGTVAVTPGPSFGAIRDEGPWLIGLAVREDMRGEGIGARLVAAAEAQATAQGATALYATVREAKAIFDRRDWQTLRDVDDSDQPGWQVMRLPL